MEPPNGETKLLKMQNSLGWLEWLSRFIEFITGDPDNCIVIILFLACFKKRDSAFSYCVLWCLQSFMIVFLKLVMRSAKPWIYTTTPDDYWYGMPTNGLACPNYSCLSTACLSVTLVIEYFYRLSDRNSHKNIQLSFLSSTNESFQSSDKLRVTQSTNS